jgi:hypothetical protein
MTHEKTIRIISNVLFGIGASLAAAAIIKSVVESASLPPGVCPFDQNRWLTYSALGALAASLILSFVGDFYRRRRKSEGQ